VLSEVELKESAERISAGLEYFQNILNANCAISMEPIKENLSQAVIISGHPLASYQKAPAPYLSESLVGWKRSQLIGLKRSDEGFNGIVCDIFRQYRDYTALCSILEIRDLNAEEREAHFTVTSILHDRLGLLNADAIRQMPQLSGIAAAVNYRVTQNWKCPTTRVLLPANTDLQLLLLFLSPFLIATWKLALLEHQSLEKAYQDEMYIPFIHFVGDELGIDLKDLHQLRLFREIMPILGALMRFQELGSRERLSLKEKNFVDLFKDWQLERLLKDFLPPPRVLRLIVQASIDEAELKEAADTAFGQGQNAILTLFSQQQNLTLAQGAVLPEEPVLLSKQDFDRERTRLRYSSHQELRQFWEHLSFLSIPHPRDPNHLISLSDIALRQNYVRQFSNEAYDLYRQWKTAQQSPGENNRRYQN
jgi:hypothetical protein